MSAAREADAIVRALPADAAAVATVQREVESELVPFVKSFEVTDHDTYEAADAILTDVVTRKDAVVNMRKSATAPAYAGIRVVEAWFKPVTAALESCERHLKTQMGAYKIAAAKKEAEQRELAARAAETGDAKTLHAALTVASSAGAPVPGRATASVGWVVARIVPAIMTHALLAEFVDAHREEFARWYAKGVGAGMRSELEPRPEAGVVFERVAKIGAKR